GGRRRGGFGLKVVGAFAFGQEQRDRRVHANALRALLHKDLAESAFVHRFHFHGGLVGLDLSNHVTGSNAVSLFLEPLGEVALLHGGRKGGHQNLGRHMCNFPLLRAECRYKARIHPAPDRIGRSRPNRQRYRAHPCPPPSAPPPSPTSSQEGAGAPARSDHARSASSALHPWCGTWPDRTWSDRDSGRSASPG